MRESRSSSQILFGHLPEQTIDADGGIWKVKRWNNPRAEAAIDASALREELIRAAYPWKENNQDGSFVDDLFAQRDVTVRSLNRDEGVWCEPFPRLYLCQSCKRLHDEPLGKCECGARRRRGQLPFVGFHEACGAIKTPYVAKCSVHGQRAVRFPGTASAAELVFYCPVCEKIIQRGFGAKCNCDEGGTLSFTVHRSGTVFKPRGVSMINPPRRDVLNQIEQAGGGERALEWLLDGMRGRNLTSATASRSTESVRKVLTDRGFDQATIEAMVAAMPDRTKTNEESTYAFSEDLRQEAERHAKQIALATYESRIVLDNLLARSTNLSRKSLYQQDYPAALARAGLERVELIDRFPVLTAQFGYTRGKSTPGQSRLRTYREADGAYTVFGELIQTEALLIRFDPLTVYRWLQNIGVEFVKSDLSDRRSAAEAILASMGSADHPNDVTNKVTKLIHSFSHAFIKKAAVYAGIDRNALSEVILPTSFTIFVYAAARGDFVLGGLQALFENDLDHLLNSLVDDEYRCALDPGCEDHHSACAVCLHLGEPSCGMFNTMLSRKVLAGGYGYFDITSDQVPS